MFAPGVVDGKWSPFEAWLRLVLDFYTAYAEVKKPLLSADGTPKLDTFGRPSADPAVKEMHGIKKGAVWFTRETLRQAWFFQFGQNLNVLDYPEHYARPRPDGSARGSDRDDAALEVKNRTIVSGQAKTRPITTHPMDPYVTRMVQDGRLIRKRGNHYMISEAMCEKLERPDAWKTHKERGSRWEGLFYEERAVAASKVKVKGRRNRILDTDVIIFQEPVAGLEGMRHPNQIMWMDVYSRLDKYLMFDLREVAMLAEKNGLLTTNPDHMNQLASAKISRWVEQGKAVKLFPSLYQSSVFSAWNAGRNRFQLPQMVTPRDYIVLFFTYQGVLQGQNPHATFKADDILAFLLNEAPDEWVEEHLKKLPSKGSVSSRLALLRKSGDLIYVAPGEFRLSDRLVDIFRPIWAGPETKEPHWQKLHEWVAELADMPLMQAIEHLTPMDRFEIVISQMERIMRLDAIQRSPYLMEISRKLKVTPTNLLKAYADYKATIA